MNSAMDRLKHRLRQGNTFAAREMERRTSLISCSWLVLASLLLFQRVRRNLSMRLKAIAFIQALESNSKMPASQRNVFSRLVINQNLASRPIFHQQQTLVE
jgi:hypothetical protein